MQKEKEESEKLFEILYLKLYVIDGNLEWFFLQTRNIKNCVEFFIYGNFTYLPKNQFSQACLYISWQRLSYDNF